MKRGVNSLYEPEIKGETKTLFKVKAFLNGNCHIKLNQEFVLMLNVKYGALKGWINDSNQAAEEMGVDQHEAEEYFNINFKIGREQLLLT